MKRSHSFHSHPMKTSNVILSSNTVTILSINVLFGFFFRGAWFEHMHQNIDCAWLLVIFKLHVFSWQPPLPVFSSILFCLSTSTDWKPWIKYLEQEILPSNRMNLLLCCAKENSHRSPWTGASHSKTL